MYSIHISIIKFLKYKLIYGSLYFPDMHVKCLSSLSFCFNLSLFEYKGGGL